LFSVTANVIFIHAFSNDPQDRHEVQRNTQLSAPHDLTSRFISRRQGELLVNLHSASSQPSDHGCICEKYTCDHLAPSVTGLMTSGISKVNNNDSPDAFSARLLYCIRRCSSDVQPDQQPDFGRLSHPESIIIKRVDIVTETTIPLP